MKFCQQLSAYLKVKEYTGHRLYQDMFEQAILCDQGGYDSVGLTEHHLINILMMPAPLQFAVKIAEATKNIKIITAVAVLPIHDMRIFAGEVIASQMFTDDRLILGVGRGAFACEMALLDSPLEDSRDKFNESLDVLKADLPKTVFPVLLSLFDRLILEFASSFKRVAAETPNVISVLA